MSDPILCAVATGMLFLMFKVSMNLWDINQSLKKILEQLQSDEEESHDK